MWNDSKQTGSKELTDHFEIYSFQLDFQANSLKRIAIFPIYSLSFILKCQYNSFAVLSPHTICICRFNSVIYLSTLLVPITFTAFRIAMSHTI